MKTFSQPADDQQLQLDFKKLARLSSKAMDNLFQSTEFKRKYAFLSSYYDVTSSF